MSNTNPNLKHECKFETPVRITTKISQASSKILMTIDGNPRYYQGGQSSPEAFRRKPKVFGYFPSISKHHPNPSEDQRLSSERFGTPGTITWTFSWISDDFRRFSMIFEDCRRSPVARRSLSNIWGSFANIFGNVWRYLKTKHTLQPDKETMCRRH